jgi:hypothetical protein
MGSHLQDLDDMETRTAAYEKEVLLRLNSVLRLLDVEDNKKYEECAGIPGELSWRGFYDCVLSRLSLIETAVQWAGDDGK